MLPTFIVISAVVVCPWCSKTMPTLQKIVKVNNGAGYSYRRIFNCRACKRQYGVRIVVKRVRGERMPIG